MQERSSSFLLKSDTLEFLDFSAAETIKWGSEIRLHVVSRKNCTEFYRRNFQSFEISGVAFERAHLDWLVYKLFYSLVMTHNRDSRVFRRKKVKRMLAALSFVIKSPESFIFSTERTRVLTLYLSVQNLNYAFFIFLSNWQGKIGNFFHTGISISIKRIISSPCKSTNTTLEPSPGKNISWFYGLCQSWKRLQMSALQKAEIAKRKGQLWDKEEKEIKTEFFVLQAAE